ncbi:MAG: hypothetical protein AAGF12_04420 [Myxococcota bacterium]
MPRRNDGFALLRQILSVSAALGLTVLSIILPSGCRENTEPEMAAALLAEVQAADYRSWARAPGYEERRPSRAAHDDSVIIYINDVVSAALQDGVQNNQWPDGSIIVKDGFDGSDLGLIAVMEKTEGTWFWAEYNGDGDTLFSGEPEICLGCHRIGDDWVRGFYFPEP